MRNPLDNRGLLFGPKYALISSASPRAVLHMNHAVSPLRDPRGLCLLWGLACGILIFSLRASAQTILIPTDAVWRYFDSGEDLGISLWRSINFVEDYRWKSGTAELGYGRTPEGRPVVTTIRRQRP